MIRFIDSKWWYGLWIIAALISAVQLPALAGDRPEPSRELINCWHIPASQEACNPDTPMRVPVTPSNPTEAVWIHTGIYPIGGAESVTLYYRLSTLETWTNQSSNWECNYNNNDFWGRGIPGGLAADGETVQYYIKITKSGFETTYIYNNNQKTSVEANAQADPFSFTFPSLNTPTPTNTPAPTNTSAPTNPPAPVPTINCWHFPANEEACDAETAMREPETPSDPAQAVTIYTGVYPITGADSVSLFYKVSTEPTWLELASGWECNYINNDYWNVSIPEDTAVWGGTIEYYIKVQKTGLTTTYLHNELMASSESEAQADPFVFTYPQEPTPTAIPTINTWHIYDSYEACNAYTSMRVPMIPADPAQDIWIHVGVYPIEGAESVSLIYKHSTESTWTTVEEGWECNYLSNDYWGAAIPADTAEWEGTIHYYLKVMNPGFIDTFISDGNTLTTSESEAIADPFSITFPSNATPTPTGSPTAIPTINAWHIPDRNEACDEVTTMRNPENPTDPAMAVAIHIGIYPITGADSVTLYYKVSTDTEWISVGQVWECNYISNDYWGRNIPAETAEWGETIHYYLKAMKEGSEDTYIFNGNMKTSIEAEAIADPFSFTFAAAPTATPTATPTSVPTVNAWHIPDSNEACNAFTSMRVPVAPSDPTQAVWLHIGVYPIGGAETVTVYYRESTDVSWSEFEANWECNYISNDYWGGPIPADTAVWDETIQYYIKITQTDVLDTFIYSGNQLTIIQAEAEANPYSFDFPEEVTPTPTGSPTPIPTINCWHIPDRNEACNTDTTMRVPLTPTDPEEPVWIHTGVYPIGGADSVSLYYRESTESEWHMVAQGDECDYNSNDYWGEAIPADAAAWDQTIQYYLKVTKAGSADTYICHDNQRTTQESVAQASPYQFTFTLIPEPLINCWHIPSSAEACTSTTTMRVPENPDDPSQAIWIHTGVYPITGADTVTIYYRESSSGTWLSSESVWECNYIFNDYWGEAIPADVAELGQSIQYYIKVTEAGFTTTYIYDQSQTTDLESEAQSTPFVIEFNEPPTPTPTPAPVCIHSGDVNNDGELSAGDAQMAFYIALEIIAPESPEQFCRANCNGDIEVSAGDAQTIFYAALGMASCSDPMPLL